MVEILFEVYENKWKLDAIMLAKCNVLRDFSSIVRGSKIIIVSKFQDILLDFFYSEETTELPEYITKRPEKCRSIY